MQGRLEARARQMGVRAALVWPLMPCLAGTRAPEAGKTREPAAIFPKRRLA